MKIPQVPWYIPKWAEEAARGIAVAVGAYLITTITTGGLPDNQEAWIALAAGALPIAWAAIRAVLNKTPVTPDEPPATP